MYKNIVVLSILLAFSTNIWANSAELDKAKITLTNDLNGSVEKSGCLAGLLAGKEKLFPKVESPKDKSFIKSQADYLDTVSQIKISTGTKKTQIQKIIKNWNLEENTPEDIKRLKNKVSGDIQALVSTAVSSFKVTADEIYNRSSFLTRKKLDAKQCGIVDDKTNRVFTHKEPVSLS